MSKETILAKIQANLAGQGNQIDISGKLTEILGEILEAIPEPTPAVEPLVVEGTVSTNAFTPGADQPSWDDAKAAFEAGTPVFLAFFLGGESTDNKILISGYNIDEGGG